MNIKDTLTEQKVRCSQLFQIQKQIRFDETPEISKGEQEEYEYNDVGHFDYVY